MILATKKPDQDPGAPESRNGLVSKPVFSKPPQEGACESQENQIVHWVWIQTFFTSLRQSRVHGFSFPVPRSCIRIRTCRVSQHVQKVRDTGGAEHSWVGRPVHLYLSFPGRFPHLEC